MVVPEEESFLGEIDPPAHPQLRGLTRQAFRPGLGRFAVPFTRAYARARLRALADAGSGDLVSALGIVLPPAVTAHMLGLDGGEIDLTPKEFDLLAMLAEAPGTVCTREDIIARVWDEHWWGPTNTLDVHIAALRRKLAGLSMMTTLRGVG